MLHFMMQNPWRAPDWRWLRAQSIHEETGHPATPRRDGPSGCKWIKRAVRFFRLYNTMDDYGRGQLALEMPALFWAHDVWHRQDQPSRWAIEAHLLARETDKEIGWKLGCAPEIIDAYEQIFFNVREKLDYKEYIINVVMGQSITRGLSERHYDLLWKLFAFSGGPHVLDSMIGRMVNATWCVRADDVSNFFQDTAINIMKKKAAVASLTVPINTNTHLNLIEAFVKYVEIERTTDSMGKAQDQIAANLHAMLGGMPFGVASRKQDTTKMLPGYDQEAVELNADEMMVVGLGFHLPYGKTLSGLSFPPPPIQNISLAGSPDESAKQGSGAENPPGKRARRGARQRRAKPEPRDREGGNLTESPGGACDAPS